MVYLPPRTKKDEKDKKVGNVYLPPRVKVEKKEIVEKEKSFLPTKSEVFLPPKKEISEVEQFNKQQSGVLKTIARILLPKKLESKYGVEKIEPVKTTLSGGWENMTPEQQTTAKEIFKKEVPTELKAKAPLFFKSLAETSTKDIPFYGSGKEALEYVSVAQAYNRVKDNKGTDKDKELLNDFYDEMERKSELSKNVGYKAGETIKGSVRFMGELLPVALVEALTGTVAPAGEAYGASKLAQKGTTEVIKKMIKDKATRNLVKNVAEKKLKTLATQFIVTAPTNITKGTAERMIGVIDTETGEVYQEGQPISEAIVNATTGHAVELATEMGGGVSGKVLSGLASPLKKVATKTAIFKALQKKFIRASDSQIEALLKKTGWNGVIGEFMEERDADILNDALYRLGLGDQKFEGLTKDDIATELLAFSVMGTGVKVGTKIAEGLSKRKDIEKMKKDTKSRKATIETPEGKEEIILPPKKATVSPKTAPTSEIKVETTKDTTPSFLPPKKAEFVEKTVEKDETSQSIQKAKAEGKSFDEWVKGQVEQSYFHSTDAKNVPLIEQGGFKATVGERSLASKGDMEKGVFFYDEATSANEFGKNFTRQGKKPATIETKVNGKIYDANNQTKYGWEDDLQIQEIASNPKIIEQLKKDGFVGVKSTELGTNATFVFEPNAIKTRSQLKAEWDKIPEVKSALPKKEKIEPIKYKTTIGKSGLAQSVRSKAIREKLIYGFDKRFRDLPDYDKRIKTEDRDEAIDFVLNNTDNAYEVAMGKQKPPAGMLPEDVYVAMVDYYIETNNVEAVLDLTQNSELVGEATLMGQRIQALSQLDPLNPANVIKDLKNIKEKKAEKARKGKTKKQVESGMKDKVNEDTQNRTKRARKSKKSWLDIIDELKC